MTEPRSSAPVPTPIPASGDRVAAFTCDDVAGLDGWRERIFWPISTPQMRRIGDQANRVVLTLIGDLADETVRGTAILTAGRLVNNFVSLAEAAFVVAAEQYQGLHVLGGPPDLPLLRGDIRESDSAEIALGKMAVPPLAHARLRAIARAASWTPLHRLPGVLLAPEVTAVSHNALLRDYARRSGQRVGFRHAGTLVGTGRATGDEPMPEAIRALPERAADALLPLAEGLDGMFRARLRRALVLRMTPVIERAWRDLVAMRRQRRLPGRIWSATHSAYATRLVAIEVRRRGGEAVGFDHGGVTAITQLPSLTAVSELSTASAFCVGTRRWADFLAATDAPRLVEPFNAPEILHGAGDPTFRQACRNRRAPGGRRRRVVYVGHPFAGLRQFAIARMVDPVYWDFQIRIVEALKAMPVDLLCKPHPEGYFKGRRNPLEDLAPTSYKPFETHLDEADVFVFDAPTSTTFGEALCTDRPIVLIDRGHYPFNPALEPRIRERCRIVATRTDEATRLWFDTKELTDAVLGNPERADPTYFRALLAGIEE